MKRCLILLLTLFLFTSLSAQERPVQKGSKKIECTPVPMPPRTKGGPNHIGKQGASFLNSSNDKSLNWSGYASFTSAKSPEIGSVQSVWGTWKVPKIHPSHTNTFSSSWIGIDGFDNQTVEQIGTAQEWYGGTARYYAWFEMYPSTAFMLDGFPVHPKDVIRASVVYAGTDSLFEYYEMIIENITRKVFTIVPTYTSESTERASAEWIVEAPFDVTTLPLAHYGQEHFWNCLTTIKGKSGGIDNKNWDYNRITMVTNSKKHVIKSKPSQLHKDGTAFSISWRHE